MDLNMKQSGCLLAAVLCLGACSQSDEVADEMQNVDFRLDATTHETVCPDTRMIGYLKAPGLSCPDGNGFPWLTSTLFAEGTDYLDTVATAPYGELARYCAYDWDGGDDNVPAAAITALANQPLFWANANSVKPDCNVMLSQGNSLADVVNPRVRALSEDRLELVSTASVEMTEDTRKPVHVYVIDTIPFGGAETEPRDDHGVVMADLIDDIACPGSGDCAVTVENILALSLFRENGVVDRDLANGGYYGRQSEVAQAIWEAIHRWDALKPASTKGKFIINLSIGFEKDWFGDAPSGSPAVAAIYHALEVASCKGGLVVAASGNDSNTCLEGPLAPAGWEIRAAPTKTRCETVLKVQNPVVPGPPVGGGPAYKPLVYAVGGLNFDNTPLHVGRVGGRPRLASVAEHAVGEDVDAIAYTGTSIAAVGASGAAALAWSYAPNLDLHQVGGLLYSSGRKLPGPPSQPNISPLADFKLGTTSFDIRRLSVCNTLDAACGTRANGCAAPLDALTCTPSSMTLDELYDAVADVIPDAVTAPTFAPIDTCETYCGVEKDFNRSTAAGAGAPNACPNIPGISRTDHLTAPQPDDPACTVCTITGSTGRVFATTNPNNDSFIIDNVSIQTYVDGEKPVVDHFGAVGLSSSMTRELVATLPPRGPVSATITITYRGYAPITDDLIITE